MSGDGFEVHLGHIRSPSGARKCHGFLRRVRAGLRPGYASRRPSRLGRYQRRSSRTFHRRVLVKMHIVRMDGIGASKQKSHLSYIQRDSASKEGQKGHVYDRTDDIADAKAFEDRGTDDRHQFRVIVSPEDAYDMVALKPFIRDLMSQMEKDLDTKLDWVAADHFNTDNPHTHIVIGGKNPNGIDLVIPKRYCFETLRERTQELVSLELGPVSQMELKNRLALSIPKERFTQIDRDILKQAGNNVVDMSGTYKSGQGWKRQLMRERLKMLVKLNLADKTGRNTWVVDSKLENILKRMGERGDILKTMHRVMRDNKMVQRLDAHFIYDPHGPSTKPMTGKIIAKGIADDVQDKAYLVVENLQGKSVYVDIGKADTITDLKKNMIVTISPRVFSPKPSDLTIEKIARSNNGIYSPSAHLQSESNVRAEFVEAHVRRLEALRRVGIVKRNLDGSWQVPTDYLKRVVSFEQGKVKGSSVLLQVNSKAPLRNLVKMIGVTWLDQSLRDKDDDPTARGFGREVQGARYARRVFLCEQGVLENAATQMTQEHLTELEKRDLKNAGAKLSQAFGKPYTILGKSDHLKGIYSTSIERPSGKYAVIERAKDFTLVPWRDVFERNRGKVVSGIARNGNISWTLGKGRGIS